MNYAEFNKLLAMLVSAGVDFRKDGRQIVLMSPDGEQEIDSCVIHGDSSLLETYQLNSCGSAEYVFNGWMQMLNEDF